jgi:hypothetical protein
MKHYLINITNLCQLKCSYCWVRRKVNTVPELDGAVTRPFQDWVNAIKADVPDVLDIGGGEPLSVDWCIDLIREFPNIRWGLSTNGLNASKIVELASKRLPQLININLSYHPEAAKIYPWYDDQWQREIIMLAEAGYPVHPNLMRTPFALENGRWAINWLDSIGIHMIVSPMCGGLEESKKPGNKKFICDAGQNVIVVQPDGNAWPCLSALNSYAWKETCLGNWLDGTVDLNKVPKPCNLWCAEYEIQYNQHEAGDFYNTHVRLFEEDK